MRALSLDRIALIEKRNDRGRARKGGACTKKWTRMPAVTALLPAVAAWPADASPLTHKDYQ